MESSYKNKRNKKITEIKTFPIPATVEKRENSISLSINQSSEATKEQIINQAFNFHSQGNISEAAKYYQYFIEKGFNDHRVFFNYGKILKDLGNLKEAEISTQKAIDINPNCEHAHYNLGIIFIDLGNLKEAEISTRRAIEIKPDFSNAHYNLGIILTNLGKLQDAEFSYRKAIAINPNFANAHFNLSNTLTKIGKSKEAEVSIRKAIEINPSFAEAHSNLGLILKEIGKLKEAELATRKAIEINPNYAEAHSNLGLILKEIGKLKEAELATRKAIEINPNYAEAHSNLGLILKEIGKLKEAEIHARKAIQIDPKIAIAYSNLGIILRSLGKLKEAEIHARKAIQIDPKIAMSYSNLGIILNDLGELKEAELLHRKAIEIEPDYADSYFNLSYLELLKGEYKSGLENYEFRLKKEGPASIHGNPIIKRIDSQDLQKGEKLLVISEQGLGDTLQYMRYIPYLRNQGFDISFCAQEKLHSLIQASDIDPNPLTPEQAKTISTGQWIPLLSLPKYLKINPENPIVTKPYIYSITEFKEKWNNILAKEKKPIIGINWQGNPKMETTYQGRSIPLEIFSILLNQNDIAILSLQKGFGSEQLENCSFRNKFVKCQPQIDSTWDFLENAAIIEACDLIITCDTSIAHLAGGMGKKVWLLLIDIPFWTWGLQKESTFWYPSMRLFRQKERHNWYPVMERVSNEIQKEIGLKI